MKKLYIKTLLIVALALVATGNAQTNVLVSEDTYAQFTTPDASQGATTDVRIKSNTGAERIGFLKFDISGFSSITSATLNLASFRNSETTAFTLTISKLSDDTWTEAALTWNNMPSKGAVVGTLPIASSQPRGAASIDVTQYILDEFADNKIVSFVLTNEDVSNGMVRLDSKESSFDVTYLSITGTTLGVEDQKIEGFTAYPNPVSSATSYRMDMFAPSGIDNIQVFSLLGQKIKDIENINSNNYSLDFSDINGKGIYLVEIQDNNGAKTMKKVIKN